MAALTNMDTVQVYSLDLQSSREQCLYSFSSWVVTADVHMLQMGGVEDHS